MRKALITIPICFLLVTSACLPKNVQEEIDKTESENKANQEVTEQEAAEQSPENVSVSPEQKKALTETEDITSEEAVNELVDPQEAIELQIPEEKSAFTSEQEFSQYIASLFFLYHTGELDAELFYERLRPHLHENFLSMLPEAEADQIETFKILQQTFLQHLPAAITKYELTDTVLLERLGEATFYRKYITEAQEPIYYQTVMREVEGQWLLFDDSPAPPYEIDPHMTESFKNPGGDAE